MPDNNTLPKVGGTFISRMKEVAAGIFSAIPILGNPATGDPIPLGRAVEDGSLPFAIDAETFALLTTLDTNIASLAAILDAYGAKATADAPDDIEAADNQSLSVNLFGALRMLLTDGVTGDPIDLSLS